MGEMIKNIDALNWIVTFTTLLVGIAAIIIGYFAFFGYDKVKQYVDRQIRVQIKSIVEQEMEKVKNENIKKERGKGLL